MGTRQVSALTTAGLGNPLVSTAEMGGSLALGLLAVLVPALAGLAVVALLVILFRRRRRRAALPA